MLTLLLASALAGCFGDAGDQQPLQPEPQPSRGGFSDTDVFPGEYVFKDAYPQVLSPGSLEILDPEVVHLTSDADGVQIEVGFFRPDTSDPVPVIVFASPYIYTGMSPPSELAGQGEYRRLVLNYVPLGYAVAFVPVRGTSDAGGCMDLMGPLERADLDQAITWLGEADWSNGNTAIIGLSYSGSTAWEVAATGNPHLKTIVTVSGVNDWFHLIYKNGTSEERGWGSIVSSYYDDGFADYNPADGTRSPQHTALSVACPVAAEGLAASQYSLSTGERDPRGFWDERNQRPGVEQNYNGSIFVIQGLQDRNVDPSNAYPWVNQLAAQGIPVKHLLGQWAHEFPDRPGEDGNIKRPDTAELFLHWFEYWLKGDTSVDLGPVAQIEDNQGTWRSESAWPPIDAIDTPLYLTPAGALAENSSAQTGEHLVAISGHEWSPVGAGVDEQCTSCATFTSPMFDQETRIAGVPRVPVTVVPTGTVGSLAASLFIKTSNERMLVGGGAINLRFAHGGETGQDLTPGQPILAKLVLEPLDIVIPPGSQLEILFHQGAYTDHLPVVPTAPVYLQSGAEQSALVVETFYRDENDLFVPPTPRIE